MSAELTPVISRKGRAPTIVPFEEPWASLRETYVALRRWRAELLSRLDLSYSEYVALELCYRTPARASDIAGTIGITSAGATDLIDRLEARRLVHRTANPQDRRVVQVDLTRVGEQLYRRAKLAQRVMLRRLITAMTDEERRSLFEGLTGLARALSHEDG